MKKTGRALKSLWWVTAPQSSCASASTMLGIWLAHDEDVQWTWTHTAQGSYVSGYVIVPG